MQKNLGLEYLEHTTNDMEMGFESIERQKTSTTICNYNRYNVCKSFNKTHDKLNEIK